MRQNFWNAVSLSTTLTILTTILPSTPTEATYKPEYGKVPFAVQQWFRQAELTKEAQKRFTFKKCCDGSDRYKTKFEQTSVGEWTFYTDPNCVAKGCPTLPIPDDIVHLDEIHAVQMDGTPDPEADKLPEFDEMRRQGVLFIYNGVPTCFWPPEGGG